MGKQRLTLAEWINITTTKRISEMFEVDISTVRHWRLGNCLPRAVEMRKIVKASKGAVTYEEMIETFLQQNSGKEEI